MASQFYKEFGDQLGAGNVVVASDEFRIVLLTAGYTPNFSTDAQLSDILSTYRKGDIVALSGAAIANGVITFNDVTVTSVPSGQTLAGYAIMQYNSGTPEDSYLMCYVDKSGDTLATDGNNVNVSLSGVAHTLIPA